jgi:phage terminase large subunit-like protein
MAKAKRLAQLLLDAKRAGWSEWIRGEGDERAVLEGCYFDAVAAARVRNFFPDLLVHSKGRFGGQPFELLEWQFRDLLGPIFGWKRADGSRRYRRSYCEIPKKNGKSTIAAGVSLYLLVGDNEPGAEVYSTATTRDQAKLVYDEAANMAIKSEELRTILDVRRSTHLILYPETASKYQAIAADADSAEGKNAHGLIVDELHAWRGRQFFESLKYAGRAREQPLFFMITTAGDDMTGICYEEHEKALRIIKAEEFDSSYFGFIAAADPDDDWKDPKTWRKANPSLGVTIKEDSFADDVKDAQGNPRKEAALKRYLLNIWVGASESWISADAWLKCAGEYSEEEFAGLPAYGGLDLSRTQDLTSLVWLIEREGLLYLFPRIFIPRGLLAKKEEIDKVPYRSWVEEGWLIATDGDVVDYARVREQVKADSELFDVRELGYDPHNAEYLCNQVLRDQDGLPTISVTQSMSNMGPPASAFEGRISRETLRHPNNPVLNWMMNGTVVYEDTNKNIRPVKRKSRGRIDGIVATIIGLNRQLAGGGDPDLDYYETNEVESF